MHIVHVRHRLVYVSLKHLQTNTFITAPDTNMTHYIRLYNSFNGKENISL